MSFEFHKHKDGEDIFDDTEPELYLDHRLHPIQNNLLKYNAKPDSLTAIITFGDGNIDHTMGDTFTSTKSVVHPNASLGLFYKQLDSQGGDIELVFYTRFLAISYAVGPYSASRKIRQECKRLETERDSIKRIEIKKIIMKNMLKLNTVMRIPALDEGYGKQEGSKTSHFRIVDWYPVDKVYVPWIAPKYKKNIGNRIVTPRWLYRGNTIHGLHDTQGCWMLFRNFLWLWPNEYQKRTPLTTDSPYYKTDFYYTGLSRCYAGVDLGYSSTWRNTCINKVLKPAGSPPTPGFTPTTRYKMFQLQQQNFVYCEFIRLFSGLKYTHSSKKIIFPRNPLEYDVSEDSSAKNEFKTNIKIPGDNYLKDEAVYFTNGLTAKIKKYKSDGGKITLYADLPSNPKKGDKFFIFRKLNCWKAPAKKYGPNFFGYNCENNTNRFWAYVYVFKRTDRFTYEKGDKKQFQSP